MISPFYTLSFTNYLIICSYLSVFVINNVLSAYVVTTVATNSKFF